MEITERNKWVARGVLVLGIGSVLYLAARSNDFWFVVMSGVLGFMVSEFMLGITELKA